MLEPPEVSLPSTIKNTQGWICCFVPYPTKPTPFSEFDTGDGMGFAFFHDKETSGPYGRILHILHVMFYMRIVLFTMSGVVIIS